MASRTVIWVTTGVAVGVLLVGCGGPKESTSRNPEAKATRLMGAGITVFSCDGNLRRVDPNTGRVLAALKYLSVPGDTGLRKGGASGCGRQRRDLRELFSSDYSKLATAWQTQSGHAVGYVTPDGKRRTVTERKRDTGFSGGDPGGFTGPRFNPNTDALWYVQNPPGEEPGYETGQPSTVYSRGIGGGKEVTRGTCDDCGDQYAVAWSSNWLIKDFSELAENDSALPVVTPDGRSAFAPLQWASDSGPRSGFAWRPWRKGTKLKISYADPNVSQHPRPSSGDLSTNEFCKSPDLVMFDMEHAFCEDGDLMTFDRPHHRVTVRPIFPATQRKISDPTLSPDKRKAAFLASSIDDKQVRLYTVPVTHKGKPATPRLVATYPNAGGDTALMRILSWS